eukprot:2544931-Rhodomonas_salina.2
MTLPYIHFVPPLLQCWIKSPRSMAMNQTSSICHQDVSCQNQTRCEGSREEKDRNQTRAQEAATVVLKMLLRRVKKNTQVRACHVPLLPA